MLKAMTKVQLGLMDPQVFKRAECTKKIFELKHSELYKMEQVEFAGITAMDLSLNGKFLLVGGVSGVNILYRTFELNNFPKMETMMPMICKSKRFHNKYVNRVQWHPQDTDMYSSSSRDGSLALWFGERSDLPVVHYGSTKTRGKEGYHCHHMNPHDPRLIAAAATASGAANGFHIMDLRLDSPSLRVAEVHPTRGAVRDGSEVQEVRWHSNSAHTVAIGSLKGFLYEWDIRSSAGPINSYGSTETTEEFFRGHTDMLSCARYAKNGLELYSLGMDGNFKKWSTTTGNLLDSVRLSNPRAQTKKATVSRPVEHGLMFYVNLPSHYPTFCITETTEPTIAFVAGEKSWITVSLADMSPVHHIPSNGVQFGHNNTCVYDANNHLLYTGGNVLAVYASTEAYSKYCEEVLGKSTETKLAIHLGDLHFRSHH